MGKRGPPLRHRLRIQAALSVGAGVLFILADWNRAVAIWLLVSGLVLAVAVLIMDRREQG